jgi:hypothetical protein
MKIVRILSITCSAIVVPFGISLFTLFGGTSFIETPRLPLVIHEPSIHCVVTEYLGEIASIATLINLALMTILTYRYFSFKESIKWEFVMFLVALVMWILVLYVIPKPFELLVD